MTTDRTVRSPQHVNLTSAPSPSQNAALRGAAMAFGKPPVKPKPNLNTYSGSDGALAAARGVGRTRGSSVVSQNEQLRTPERQTGHGDQRLAQQSTGGSGRLVSPRSGSSRRSPSRPRMGRLDSSGFLQPGNTPGMEGRSPSFIAATLAASRSASISPNVTGQSASGFGSQLRPSFAESPSLRRTSSKESEDTSLDLSSIPPTNSLIGMFERNTGEVTQQSRQPVRRTHHGQPPKNTSHEERSTEPSRSRALSSPTPRKVNLVQKSNSPSPAVHVAPKKIVTEPTPTLKAGSIPHLKPKPNTIAPSSDMLELQRGSNVVAPTPRRRPLSLEASVVDETQFPATFNKRPLPPPRRISPNKQQPQSNSHSNSNTHLSVDSANTQINAMANAIVASSLASSRAASPAKQSLQPPPPPPSRRGARGKDHFFHSHKDSSRTPSPVKQNGLRTTMRKPRLEEEPDEGEKRRTKKHNIMKKHPNKHAEGDRKRWRDAITERERKRYEAVWASNKGLHVFPTFPGSESVVCNIVVKDIFSRSRLHLDVLEEVYTLVDRKKNGNLEREEFVVGLWLIDQRLKGRKLPIRVSDHVWRSVGGLQGIKVKNAHRG